MDYRNLPTKAAIAAAALLLAVGCSTTDPAPFHMYSSPLLEGEMDTDTAGSNSDNGTQSRPGVEPRQVYAYQRWGSDSGDTSVTADEAHADSGSQQRPGTFDTVQPPDEPVLADYTPEPTDNDVPEHDAAPPTQKADTSDDHLSDDSPVVPATGAAGYVFDVLSVNGIEFDGGTAESIPAMYRTCRAEGETFQSGDANIGDLVFFHNTYDANDDGRNNDWYTLVGVIEHIDSDGTITFLAYLGGQVRSLKMNLEHLDQHQRTDGQVTNSRLRKKDSDDPPFTQYLAGQLFAGFCDVLGDTTELILIDQWTPETPLSDSHAQR